MTRLTLALRADACKLALDGQVLARLADGAMTLLGATGLAPSLAGVESAIEQAETRRGSAASGSTDTSSPSPASHGRIICK